MRKLSLLAATAVAASLAAGPVLAQDAYRVENGKTMKTHKAGKHARAQQMRMDRNADMSYERGFTSGYDRGYQRSAQADRVGYNRSVVYDRGYANDGFWPADVAVGATAGALSTAGAIASAPFRDTYAYDAGYDDSYTPAPVYRNTWNDGWNGAWNTTWDNNWAGQSYAQRNGFVCTPGTWFTNSAGYTQLCQ